LLSAKLSLKPKSTRNFVGVEKEHKAVDAQAQLGSNGGGSASAAPVSLVLCPLFDVGIVLEMPQLDFASTGRQLEVWNFALLLSLIQS